VLDKLLSDTRLGEDEDIDKYLNRYDEIVQRLYILGWNNRERTLPTGEDTDDFMIGVNLIRSVAGHRFDDQIAKDDNDKLLKAPTCTYVWAKNRVKKWSDEGQTSFKTVLGTEVKSRKRSIGDVDNGESAFKKATVMLAKVFDHANQVLKNKINNSTSVEEQSNKGGRANNFIDYAEWKNSKTCPHCQEKGHFASECPKATAEQRAEFLAAHLERKKAKKTKTINDKK
jgi:hypothetical protein